MDGRISIRYLQSYIKSHPCRPDLVQDYFLKLAEETGELARAMYRGLRPASPDEVRGSIDEEIWDVIYFALAIANCYDIDVESVIPKKEAFNAARYPGSIPFEMDR